MAGYEGQMGADLVVAETSHQRAALSQGRVRAFLLPGCSRCGDEHAVRAAVWSIKVYLCWGCRRVHSGSSPRCSGFDKPIIDGFALLLVGNRTSHRPVHWGWG
jgi:hypothetical protein